MLGFPVCSHGAGAQGAGRLEKPSRGTLSPGWQVQAGTGGGGGLLGWVTFVSYPRALILVESEWRWAHSSIPDPTQTDSDIQERAGPQMDVRLSEALCLHHSSVPASEGPSASQPLGEGAQPPWFLQLPGVQAWAPNGSSLLPPRGQAKLQTLNVQLPPL